jgi:hypothetical protein
MSDAVTLSNALAAVVEAAAPSVVRVAGESHGVTGLAWDDDLVVTVADALERTISSTSSTASAARPRRKLPGATVVSALPCCALPASCVRGPHSPTTIRCAWATS